METNACPGAGEDVEAVLARLQTQAVENANLKDRQAKLEQDQQVISVFVLCRGTPQRGQQTRKSFACKHPNREMKCVKIRLHLMFAHFQCTV